MSRFFPIYNIGIILTGVGTTGYTTFVCYKDEFKKKEKLSLEESKPLLKIWDRAEKNPLTV